MEEYFWKKTINVAGFDVGKRGNPSHMSVFAIQEDPLRVDEKENPIENLIMIHQKFCDAWEYVKQIEYIKSAIEYFKIQRLYYDATRSELDERGLPRQCIPIVLSNRTGAKAKGKMELATNFAKLVEQKRIELINEDRFIGQILCVTNDLQAPNTPRGHGDSFISIILAVGVYFDFYASGRNSGTTTICNIQDIIGYSEEKNPSNIIPISKSTESAVGRSTRQDVCKICGGRVFEQISGGTKKVCKKCFTIW